MVEALISTALFVGLAIIIGEPLWKKASPVVKSKSSSTSGSGRFCRMCGASVTLNDRFCHACGQQLV